MIIKSIQLKNFLCYYGENNFFEFSEGLNLVLGANGYGKTKLYDSFLWVMKDYISDNSLGNRVGYKRTDEVKKDLISHKALAECEIGDSVKAEVIFEVEDSRTSQNKSYRIIRSYIANHKSDGVWVEQSHSKFEILEKDVLHFKPVPESNNRDILDHLIPSDVQPYVWFQGERGINNLIDTTNDASLKNVIRKLSDIDKWDKYITVSAKAAETATNSLQRALRASQKNKGEILILQTREGEQKRKIDRLKIEVEEAQNNLTAAQTKYDDLSSIFENAQNLNKLKKDKLSIERDIENLEKRIDDFHQSFSKNLFSRHWLLDGMEIFVDEFEKKYQHYSEKVVDRKAQQNLKNKIDKQLQTRLPKGVPEPVYIKTMLEKEHCLVCDRSAKKGRPEYQAIARLLESEPQSETESLVKNNFDPIYRRIYHAGLSLKDVIGNIDQDRRNSLMELQQMNDEKRSLKDRLNEKDKEIQDQLTISNIENPKSVIDSVNNSLGDIKRYSSKMGENKVHLETAENELKNIYQKLDELSEGEVPEILKTKRDLLSDFSGLAQRVKDNKYQELIEILEQQANTHYTRINAPTGAFYGKIKFKGTLEGGYKPIIVDNGEESKLLNTSLISSMKLSIIMAIVSANKQRNYNHSYPLIADAPTSDFDDVKMKFFLKEVASTFRQSIIITKEMLIEDTGRINRYKPDVEKINDLKKDLDEINSKIKLYQIDFPDGVSLDNKNQIELNIKTLNI